MWHGLQEALTTGQAALAAAAVVVATAQGQPSAQPPPPGPPPGLSTLMACAGVAFPPGGPPPGAPPVAGRPPGPGGPPGAGGPPPLPPELGEALGRLAQNLGVSGDAVQQAFALAMPLPDPSRMPPPGQFPPPGMMPPAGPPPNLGPLPSGEEVLNRLAQSLGATPEQVCDGLRRTAVDLQAPNG